MKILVIGDSCKDVFVYGSCDRMAPAAPVPVFIPQNLKDNKGMAGNVYQNFRSLSVDCDLITNTSEITKTRYIDQTTNHMIIRVDSGEEKIERVVELDKIEYSDYSAVVISDYNKGFLTEQDVQFISESHDMVFMDTKKLLGDWAKEVNFIKINKEEYNRTRHLLTEKDWFNEKLIVTVGSSGCLYNGEHFPVQEVEIKDLTGAGDSFLTGFVYKYLETKDTSKSLKFANECATIVVQQKGVNTINDI
mgnify:CR=1 FL=1